MDARSTASTSSAPAVEEASTGETIDAEARRKYEQRIRDLQADIDEAESNSDYDRAYRHQDELDTLIEHLTAALGHGNRTRRAAGSAERARSAVTHRVRTTIRQLGKLHPQPRPSPDARRQHRDVLQLPAGAADCVAHRLSMSRSGPPHSVRPDLTPVLSASPVGRQRQQDRHMTTTAPHHATLAPKRAPICTSKSGVTARPSSWSTARWPPAPTNGQRSARCR